MDIDFDKFQQKYSECDKFKSFLYHLYIITVGAIIQPDKHKQYVAVFDEFVKQKQGK